MLNPSIQPVKTRGPRPEASKSTGEETGRLHADVSFGGGGASPAPAPTGPCLHPDPTTREGCGAAPLL